MEGYLWKRGRNVPRMKRRYAVLKGTMLSFYLTQNEAQRSKAVPKRVLELTDVRIMPATSPSNTTHPPHIVLNYLDAKGGGTLQCRAESIETQQVWLASLQHALEEPDRMAQLEIAEVQEELKQDVERHSEAVQQATEAVKAAGRQHREQAHAEVALQQSRVVAVGLITQLETAKTLHWEAIETLKRLQQTLEDEKLSKGSSLDREGERVAAKVEVAASAEAAYERNVTLLQAMIQDNSSEQLELVQRVQQCTEESKGFRQMASKSLGEAQRTKQRAERLASWNDETTDSPRRSHLDPLVEGYLQCQHPTRTTMHRRYYVLTGNTLCWYADQDAYVHKMDAPNGVLHVAVVSEWDGRAKPSSPMRRLVVPFSHSPRLCSIEEYSHHFAVHTIEGTTLYCSAPLLKDQKDWIAALYIGLIMPPLSPHRARAAKSRRNSFDLLASTLLSPKRQSSEQGPQQEAKVAEPIATTQVSSLDKVTLQGVVEGYLVIKTSQEKRMINQYCVLRALVLSVGVSNQAGPSGLVTTFTIVGVSTWDGHTPVLQYDHGFLLQTSHAQNIYCSAPTLEERTRWIHSVQQALVHSQPPKQREYHRSMQAAAIDQDALATGQLSYSSAQNELLVVLQQYYSEHHPGKFNDVPMLLSRYQGREQALVEHLDRLYGTSMGANCTVKRILAALLLRPSPFALLPLSAPPSPVTRSGDHSDWLTWNDDTAPSFCVLTGIRLERFGSEAHSRVNTPLSVFVVTKAHDYPVPSPTTRVGNLEFQFFISGRDEHLTSSTEFLVLEATSIEAKEKWMAKLRSALGVVESEARANVSTSSKQPQAVDLQQKEGECNERSNPKRGKDVDPIITDAAARKQQVTLPLDATNASSDATFAALVPSSSAVNHCEGYLSVAHPLVEPLFRKCYCVLDGTNWQCFDSVNRHMAIISDVVVSVHPVTAKLAEQLTFRFETQLNGVILLRADAVEMVYEWTQVLCAVVASHSSMTIRAEKPTRDQASVFDELRSRIVAVYDMCNPSKVSEVDTLLQSFEGREGALLEQIDTVYKSHLATDPLCTSLCAALAAGFANKLQNTAANQPLEIPLDGHILMEGYLMKRGHRVPTMRKRYCVLIRNELSYYVSHDDSKNPSRGAATIPLGSFRVEIVGDWHGKSTTHTYKHAMELETTDGKTFFCAASTAREKKQWIDAFHRGIALVQSAQRRKSDDNASETKHERRLRDQFRCKLVDFYRLRNPAKLSDLDLLLSCYVQREMALLQAIDEAYGTNLAADKSLLALLPPRPQQATALATLKLDGYLKKTASDNAMSLWKRVQTIYVTIDGLTITLYATHEEFKSQRTKVKEGMIVLAVKEDNHHSANHRFAVETSDHEWLHFEASDAIAKRLWVQVLRAALDTVLAQSLLADAYHSDTRNATGIDKQGFLLVRMDFNYSQHEHWKRREVVTSMEECSVALEHGNEFVVRKVAKADDEQARFQVLNTRAWIPEVRCWPVTVGHRAPRFPFQIVMYEQFVLSCSAATDVERADWIRHLRAGAEQAAALEVIEDQLLETKAPLSPCRQSFMEKQNHKVCNRDMALLPQSILAHQQTNDNSPLTGYLSIRLANSVHSFKQLEMAQRSLKFFLVLGVRAHVAVYTDENSYCHKNAPICKAQAVKVLSDVVAFSHSQTTKSTLQQFIPESTNAVSLRFLTFSVVLRMLNHCIDATGNDSEDDTTATLELFFTLPSQRDQWEHAFVKGIENAKGDARFKDEVMVQSLEQDEHENHRKIAIANVFASDREHDDANTDDRGFEDKSMTLCAPGATKDSDSGANLLDFVFQPAAMEGMLTPWQSSASPIRMPGSPKMKATQSVYAVLIGCQLRCYPSQEAAMVASLLSHNRTVAVTDQSLSLDIEITACSSWEVPTSSWYTLNKESENLGLKVGVKGSHHSLCFTAPTIDAKHQWIQVMHHELNNDAAERSLSLPERQFTDEVAAHLAAATENAGDNSIESAIKRSHNQGYLRMRHHNLGSIWQERFAVLENSTLTIFPENCGWETWSEKQSSKLALEKHELVGVENWHPVFTRLSRNGPELRGTGFRIETTSGIYLEFIAKTPEIAFQWKSAITAATTKETTQSSISRDATLPFIPGSRMEGYLKLKDSFQSDEKSIKVKSLKPWKTRYCIVMGSHWLVYANQAQAVSSSEAPTPVAVYELLGIAKDDVVSTNEFLIHVNVGRQVKCRARSSLERKRWVNAVEDELLVHANTLKHVEKSLKEHETKLAARNAVKSKLHEMKSDARRLSMLLGEVIQSTRGDLSTSDDDDSLDDDFSLRERVRPDYIDGSPESSPMRRNGRDLIASRDIAQNSKPPQKEAPSILSFFACFSQCIPIRSTKSNGRNVVTPLGIPEYPLSAACTSLYTCEYYKDDGYRGVTK